MNKFYTIIAASLMAASFTMPADAQSKLNMQGTAMLEEYRAQKAERIRTLGLKAVEAEAAPREGAIVMLNDGENADCLRRKGFEVLTDLGSIVTVVVSMDSVQTLVDMPEVKSVSMGGKNGC